MALIDESDSNREALRSIRRELLATSSEVDAFHAAARNADIAKLGHFLDWFADPDLWTAFVQQCTARSTSMD